MMTSFVKVWLRRLVTSSWTEKTEDQDHSSPRNRSCKGGLFRSLLGFIVHSTWRDRVFFHFILYKNVTYGTSDQSKYFRKGPTVTKKTMVSTHATTKFTCNHAFTSISFLVQPWSSLTLRGACFSGIFRVRQSLLYLRIAEVLNHQTFLICKTCYLSVLKIGEYPRIIIMYFIIHQIFSLARDWSKRVTWANIPQLKLGNIRGYSPVFKTDG